MFVTRELPETTLKDVAEAVTAPSQSIVCSTEDIRLELLEDDPSIAVRTGSESFEEITASGAKVAFANFLKIPLPFINRIPVGLAQTVIGVLLSQTHGEVRIRFDDYHVQDIYPSSRQTVEPIATVEIAADVIGDDAQVLEWWYEPGEFRLDVVSSVNGLIGGDLEVGDISHGGLRYSQNLKNNLAPSVEKLIYRLICTNGMEVPDTAEKLDARGDTIEEFLDSYEIASRRLYSEVEGDIAHFYDLRNQPIGDPSQAVLRIAGEHNLNDRTTVRLVDQVPSLIPGDEATQFDVVNLITNTAVDHALKAGPRRQLERVGGFLVNEHTARCRVCSARLTS